MIMKIHGATFFAHSCPCGWGSDSFIALVLQFRLPMCSRELGCIQGAVLTFFKAVIHVHWFLLFFDLRRGKKMIIVNNQNSKKSRSHCAHREKTGKKWLKLPFYQAKKLWVNNFDTIPYLLHHIAGGKWCGDQWLGVRGHLPLIPRQRVLDRKK